MGVATVGTVGMTMAIAVTLLHRNLPGLLLGDFIANLPRHLNWNLHWDILATLPGDLLWHLMALLDRDIVAFLVIAIAMTLLLVGSLARLLIDSVIVGLAILLVFCLVVCVILCVALVLIDSLVDGLVGGVAIFMLLVLVAMTMTVAAMVRMGCCST